MMERQQSVIPIPYNLQRLKELYENDFPEVKKSIEDFFETDYWKINIDGFLNLLVEEGKKLGYTQEALAEARNKTIKKMKDAIYSDVFCSALSGILIKSGLSWYNMNDEMLALSKSVTINVFLELTISELKKDIENYLKSLFNESYVFSTETYYTS